MEHLFVVRHGETLHNSLSLDGRRQMELIGDQIKKILNGDSVYMVSSTMARAFQSADIIKDRLGLDNYERLVFLCGGDSAPPGSYDYVERNLVWETKAVKEQLNRENLSKLIAVVEERENEADGLIVITHLGISGKLINDTLKSRLGIDYFLSDNERGEGMYFNFNVKTFSRIPFKPYEPKQNVMLYMQQKIDRINKVYDDYEETRSPNEPFSLPFADIPLFLRGAHLDRVMDEIRIGNPLGRERYYDAERQYLRELWRNNRSV